MQSTVEHHAEPSVERIDAEAAPTTSPMRSEAPS